MTVLRSREIVPTIKSQSPLETLKKGIIEPATPLKLIEPATNTIYSTPGSSASPRSATPIGLGSDSASVLGAARRRSLRLASGLSVDEITASVTVSNRKRKSVVAENWMKPKNEYGLENVGRDSVGIIENGVSDFRVTKVRVSDRIRMKNRVRSELGMDEEKVETGERNLDSSTAASLVDVVTEGRGVSNFGSPSDLRSFTQASRRLLSDRKEKGKRKSGKDDLLALELVREGSNKGLLNLRSGRKISKRRMEGNSDDVDFMRFGSDDGHKSVHVNGGGDEDKASERVLNGEIGKGFVMNKSARDPGVDEIGTLEGRRRFSGALIEVVDQVETVELDLCCNLEMSSGNAVSDIVHLPGNLGLKELDKAQMSDDICSGGKARTRLNREEKGKGKVVEVLSNGNAVSDAVHFPENVGLKELEKDPMTENRAVKARRSRRLSREEKGKGKVFEDSLLSNGIDAVELDLELKVGNSTKKAVSSTLCLADDVSVEDERQVVGTNTRANVMKGRDYKDRFRDIAKQNASRFAHFSSQEVEENHVTNEAESEMPRREADGEMEDWPGPFSTAMKIIKDRQLNVNVPQQNSFVAKSKAASVIWVPKKDQHRDSSKQSIPQLQDLCMAILAKNADAITSLESVPDVLRHKLSQLLCDSRRMNSHFLGLLVHGSPTEIRIRDCSWLTEEQFTRTFQGCEASNLVVLQLDQCGRCLPDYVLNSTLARLPNRLPALTAISLKGACRLSDVGLSALITSAPALRSINLSQCSLLTSDGVNTLADSMGSVLRELYIDDCENIDAMLILTALSKLEHLEVLSVVGIQTVCDDFVSKFIATRGHTIKELVLTDCVKLTDSSLKVIAETCNGLRAIDLGNLCRLTDSTMGYLANGCRAIETLKLRRNSFSDEAVAAYLEASGESLNELSLNNVHKVGHNTAISLARHSSRLFNLDLSWCRNLTNEALGLIVDGCLSLKVLKLFGCTQITNVFLDGHSNPQVQIIGLKMTPILEHLKVPDPLEGPLHY